VTRLPLVEKRERPADLEPERCRPRQIVAAVKIDLREGLTWERKGTERTRGVVCLRPCR